MCTTLIGSAAVAQRPQLRRYHVSDHVNVAAGPAVAESLLVFTGVTVVDVTNGRLLPAQAVVISGNRVQSIQPVDKTNVPAGARVVDAKGKYMIPGLWDMHVHIDGFVDSLYSRFIAHGITGVREMAQKFPFGTDSFRVWQREVMAGTRVGPRSIGPSAEYPYHFHGKTTREEVLRTIDSLKAQGMVFLKYHDDYGDRDLFLAIVHEARRVGLPILGHVPWYVPGNEQKSVSSVEAADSGYVSVEHVNEIHQCWPHWPAPLGDSAAAEKRCAPVVQAYIRDSTWLVPTHTVEWLFPTGRDKRSAALFKDHLRMVRMLHRLGVTRFLAGSDWQPYSGGWKLGNFQTLSATETEFAPGLSSAEELVFFCDAGFTPLQALQTGTLNPAMYLHGTDSLGTVAVGKLADLVLLDGNPLADIHNVLRVRAVVANGRYFDRAKLDSLDPTKWTKPGVGLVARQQRNERLYSHDFIAGTDTTEVELTDKLVTRYITLWKDLKAFWDQHTVLLDSAKKNYEDFPICSIVPEGAEDATLRLTTQKWPYRVAVFDYVALVTQDSALANIFAKDSFPPQQLWSLKVTLAKEVYRMTFEKEKLSSADSVTVFGTSGSVIAKNIAFMKAHEADLAAILKADIIH